MLTLIKYAVCFQVIEVISSLFLQPKFQFNNYSFSVSLVDTGEKQYCSMQAEDKVNPDGNIFKLDVGLDGIESVTDGLCKTPEMLENYLSLAFMNYQNLSVNHVHLNKKGELGIFVQYNLINQQRSFVLFLHKIKISNDIKINKLFEQYYSSDDRFCMQENLCYHQNINVYHSGRAVVKVKNSGSYHEASTGIRYLKGIHYLEFRIVRCSARKGVLFGVASELYSLTNFPGFGEQKSGKSLYTDGDVYANGAHSSYNLGVFIAGDYIGVLLNMNNKTVAFSINGRYGAVLPLVESGHYFTASLMDIGDSIEIVSENCYHRDE